MANGSGRTAANPAVRRLPACPRHRRNGRHAEKKGANSYRATTFIRRWRAGGNDRR